MREKQKRLREAKVFEEEHPQEVKRVVSSLSKGDRAKFFDQLYEDRLRKAERLRVAREDAEVAERAKTPAKPVIDQHSRDLADRLAAPGGDVVSRLMTAEEKRRERLLEMRKSKEEEERRRMAPTVTPRAHRLAPRSAEDRLRWKQQRDEKIEEQRKAKEAAEKAAYSFQPSLDKHSLELAARRTNSKPLLERLAADAERRKAEAARRLAEKEEAEKAMSKSHSPRGAGSPVEAGKRMFEEALALQRRKYDELQSHWENSYRDGYKPIFLRIPPPGSGLAREGVSISDPHKFPSSSAPPPLVKVPQN